MKLPRFLTLIPLTLGFILPLSANEYKFEEIKFDQTAKKQNRYEPKDKLDEYIIKAATYSTKFVPLMNQGAEGSEYTDLMFSDCLLYTSPSPRDREKSRMPSSA